MIKAPGWCHTAVPTVKGWEDPNSGELLVSGRHTQAQVDEWHGVPTMEFIQEIAEPVIEHEETEWVEYDLQSMSKLELEELGREYGIELDRREKKETLIEQLEVAMSED